MRIKTFGNNHLDDNHLSQIEYGFKSFGHSIIDNVNDADVIYSNDVNNNIPLNTNIKKIVNIKMFSPNSFENDRNYLKSIYNYINNSHKITCSNNTIRKNILKYLGIDTYVIPNPIEVSLMDNKFHKVDFLFFNETENSPVVKELISVSSNVLFFDKINKNYNEAKFSVFSNEFYDIESNIIESVISGCIPIFLNIENPIKEYLPLFCRNTVYGAEGVKNYIESINNNLDRYTNSLNNLYSPYFSRFFNKFTISESILNLFSR